MEEGMENLDGFKSVESVEGGCSGDCSSCGEAEKEPEAEAPAEEPVTEALVEEAPAEEPVEEAVAEPATESVTEPVVEEPKEEGTCCCSEETTKSAEDMVRDLVNLVNVYKEEEKMGVSTRIDPATAEELSVKLGELAQKVGDICSC